MVAGYGECARFMKEKCLALFCGEMRNSKADGNKKVFSLTHIVQSVDYFQNPSLDTISLE